MFIVSCSLHHAELVHVVHSTQNLILSSSWRVFRLEYVLQYNFTVRSYGPDTNFGYMSLRPLPTCRIYICMSLDQGHDTPVGHGKKCCEILSWSNKTVRSLSRFKEFGTKIIHGASKASPTKIFSIRCSCSNTKQFLRFLNWYCSGTT